MGRVELLAPAGSREALTAAVESGADAVYLAGNRFGARAYADNFDEEGLREAIGFAHLRHVAVHVTVNTAVADSELRSLAEYLRFLYEAGADAVLVQDLGAARLAKKLVPELPLHASTQMTVHNYDGVKALEELGFSRVVLSRELSLKEIRQICSKAKAEIEVFMHGALCVCYSGQCLMSSMIGGRSGNRGRCAQPCRLPYTLVDSSGHNVLEGKAGEYLLSPRDLNTIDLIPELLEAGVSSLKIEGRMKRPEYVAVVVNTYRNAIDSYERDGAYRVTDENRRNLAQIFNRDFTTAYLEKVQGAAMMSDRRPNNRGLLLGRVTGYDREKRLVTVKLSEKLNIGDQVDFWVKVGGRVAVTIGELWDGKGKSVSEGLPGQEVCFSVPSHVRVHDRVFKVYDSKLMEKAKSFWASGAPVRRIPVSVEVKAHLGEPMRIYVRDADGFEAEAETEFIAEPAKNRPLNEDAVKKQISRLGTSIFSLEECRVELQENLMVPVSEINDARRRAVQALEECRLEQYRRSPAPRVDFPRTKKCKSDTSPAELTAAVDSIPLLEAAVSAGVDGILFGGESYHHELLAVGHYQKAVELVRNAGKRIYFNTPRIVRGGEQKQLEKILEAAVDLRPEGVYVHNIGTLHLAKEYTDIPVYTDYSLISYNSMTLEFLAEQGIAGATLSPELTWQQVNELAAISPITLECIVHGRLELMVSSYCVTGSFLGNLGEGACSRPCGRGSYSLRDRKQVDFPLVMDQFCRMHVLNSKVLSMLPYGADFGRAGIRRMRIEGRAMEAEELSNVIRAYQEIKEAPPGAVENPMEDLRHIEGKDITRGHYFRGVL
ncbi:MAG TPA: peptidase U32 [Selenomonas sp.]|nr:peptidase U32 [Selenomonas sp.]